MTYVAYLSHPIGDSDTPEQRGDNIENAGRWLAFIIDNTKWAVMCPWLAYTVSMNSALYGPRALTDQIALLERCDLLVQVGGWLSPHMEIEQNHAKRHDVPIINLTRFGDRPSSREQVRTTIAQAMRQQIAQVRAMKKRRVWLPPLDDSDIEALRAAQVMLQTDPFSADSRALIQRIVHAALRPV